MFKLTSNTSVNRDFKTREILKLIEADKEAKREAAIINKITLTDVLSEDTLNIKATEECKEIYIIKIELKEKEEPIEFIKAFDKFINLHTYFLLQYENEVKELCIFRYIENEEIKRGKTYETLWIKEELKSLPYVMSIGEIYSNLIYDLVSLKPKDNEELKDYLSRFDSIRKLKKEIKTLQKRAFKEAQPKKKFEISKQLKSKKEVLKTLEGDINGQT